MAAVEFANLSLFSDANLVSYYKLENVNDSKGANTLTNNGTISFNAAKFNNGAEFGSPNTTKYFSATATYVTTGTDWSVAWWLKTGGKSTVSFASDVGGGGSDEYYLIVDASASASFHYCNSDGSEGDATGTYTAFDNSLWHHAAFTAKTSGSDWIATLYLDGVVIGTSTVIGKTKGKLGNINIGRIIVEANNYSTELIDDLVIFNRALTTDEIGIIYNGPTASQRINYSQPTGFIEF